MRIVEAVLTVAEGRVTGETLAMADAVVLLTIVRLAIAAFSDGVVQAVQLVVARLHCRLSLVVLAIDALADAWQACCPLFQANAVELVTASMLAVAGRLLLHTAAVLLQLEGLMMLKLLLLLDLFGRLVSSIRATY